MKPLWLAGTLAALMLFAARAHAEPETPESLAAEAQQHYLEGRYARAAELLTRAYGMKANPLLLLNLAKTYRRLGDTPNELDAWKRYLEARPDAPDRASIEARIRLLEAPPPPPPPAPTSSATPTPQPAPTPPPARPSEPPVFETQATGRSPAPWIVGGVGAAGLLTGGVLGALALVRHNAALEQAEGQRSFEVQRQASSFATASTVSLVTGGILLTGGIVWWILDHPPSSMAAGSLPPLRISF